MNETIYYNKVQYDNFENIFDKGTMLKLSQLLKSEGIILFSDTDNNIWEIVKRCDLKPDDLLYNLDTISSITYPQNNYIDDKINCDYNESEIGVSMEVDVSRFTDKASMNMIQETVNDMSEIIIQ